METGAEFAQLIEPHRRELQAHCYRMLGSTTEAEEATQEALTKAWRRRATFQGTGTVRAWLYKIATNACLDALKKRPHRSLPIHHADAGDPTDSSNQGAAGIEETLWLEPYPDELLPDPDGNPEDVFQQRESIHLAFMVALHLLAPRQRAVLLLCDVLEWSVGEIATTLRMTQGAVNSALHRARTRLAGQHERPQPATQPSRERTLLGQYVDAWERADVDKLVSLLTNEAVLCMPPDRRWLAGRAAIDAFMRDSIFNPHAGNRWKLVPTRANGCPAVGFYLFDADSQSFRAFGVQVLELSDGYISGITAFRTPALLPRFGLPGTLTEPPPTLTGLPVY